MDKNSLELGGNTSFFDKSYETVYPPSPTMSTSSYYDELQDFDAPWQQQQNEIFNIKRSSRTSSPQGHPVATMVSGFGILFNGVATSANNLFINIKYVPIEALHYLLYYDNLLNNAHDHIYLWYIFGRGAIY